jgi:hypothetical protein
MLNVARQWLNDNGVHVGGRNSWVISTQGLAEQLQKLAEATDATEKALGTDIELPFGARLQ